jgi:hypothetical protein
MNDGINFPSLNERLNGKWDDKQQRFVKRDISQFIQLIKVINRMNEEEEL